MDGLYIIFCDRHQTIRARHETTILHDFWGHEVVNAIVLPKLDCVVQGVISCQCHCPTKTLQRSARCHKLSMPLSYQNLTA